LISINLRAFAIVIYSAQQPRMLAGFATTVASSSGTGQQLAMAISVATAVGFIALAGVAAEFGVVMLVCLENALKHRLAAGAPDNEETLLAAVREGAVLRVRPKAMTVAIVLAGLIPMMWGHGTGSEIMARIAAPMVGGMVTAPLLSMLVVPAAWYLLHRRRFNASRLSHRPIVAPLPAATDA
jgi:Cu(I)/Ag(I) efflux system membrane protein CusA/SilA